MCHGYITFLTEFTIPLNPIQSDPLILLAMGGPGLPMGMGAGPGMPVGMGSMGPPGMHQPGQGGGSIPMGMGGEKFRGNQTKHLLLSDQSGASLSVFDQSDSSQRFLVVSFIPCSVYFM